MDFNLFGLHMFDDKIMNVRKMKEKECSWEHGREEEGVWVFQCWWFSVVHNRPAIKRLKLYQKY